MKGEVKEKPFPSRPGFTFTGRPACIPDHPEPSAFDPVAVRYSGITAVLTGFFFRRNLAAEAVGTVENSTRAFCGEFSKRCENGGKTAFWFFHGFHRAAVSTAFPRAPQTSTVFDLPIIAAATASPDILRPSQAGFGWVLPTTVLSEPSALQLYPVVRGGI